MTEYVRTAAPAGDQLDTLVSVLDLVRTGQARTRPELGRRSGLGRTVITQRVQQLIDCGLLEEGALGPSSGGRAPRELRFRADAGHLLVAELGATRLKVAVTDLAGTLLEQQETAADITRGPEHTLHQVEEMFNAAVTARPAAAPPIWGIGISVPGPVEFATGRTIAPPIMPGWDGYPVRERLAAAFQVPVWVDNDVNLMALGELRSGLAQGERDVVYIKIGTGIGAGLISGGRLHRGAQGCAGDVGHVAVVDDTSIVCRCGKTGCLEALAGGAALAREATAAAVSGRSPYLAELLNERPTARRARRLPRRPARRPVQRRTTHPVRAARRGDAGNPRQLLQPVTDHHRRRRSRLRRPTAGRHPRSGVPTLPPARHPQPADHAVTTVRSRRPDRRLRDGG